MFLDSLIFSSVPFTYCSSFFQLLLDKGGQNKRRPVHLRGIIFKRFNALCTHRLFKRSGHFSQLHLLRLSRNTEPNLSRRIGGDGGVRVGHLGKESTGLREKFSNELEMQPHALSLGA